MPRLDAVLEGDLAAAEGAAAFGNGKAAIAVRVHHQEPARHELADQRQPRGSLVRRAGAEAGKPLMALGQHFLGLVAEQNVGWLTELEGRAYMIRGGSVIANGPMAVLSSEETMRAAYLGEVT